MKTGLYNLLLVVQVLSIVLLMLECAFIITRWKTKLHGLLFFVCVSLFLNNIGYLMEMMTNTMGEFIIALKLSYAGRIWIPFALLYFTLNLCNQKYKKWVVALLAVIHAFTFVLVLTFEHNTLYYSSYRYVLEGLFPHLVCTHGLWYVLYQYILVNVYVVFGIYLLITNTIREKDEQVKKRLFTITLSIIVDCVFFIMELMGFGSTYDMTMLGYSIGALIMAIGLFRYDIMGTMEMAKDFCLEEIPEGVIVINPLGSLEFANDRAKTILKLIDSENVSNSKIQETVDMLEDRFKNKKILEIDESIYSVEKKNLIHNGSPRGTVYVLEDDTGIYNYMKALEEQKAIAEAAKDEAESASASKSAFLSIVSHEIRTPMNAVVGMTELLLREPDDLNDKQQKYLNNIKNSGAALVMLVNDILDQSKIEAGKMEIIEDDYEIRPMVEDVMMIIENRVGSKPINLITDIDDSVPTCLVGDSLRIRQILINLMNNAVKFTEEGFIRLTIECLSTENNRKSIKFTVKDSGQGIKAEDLSKLGEAFSQVDTKKNHSKEGTGLGLSISKNFIGMMGGQLEVDSVYGEGTSFFFTISQGISEGVETTNDSGVQKQAWQSEAEFTCPEVKLLVVDDNELNLMIAEELLKPLECITVTASSGEETLKLIEDCSFDIILIDYMMPYMDGVETTVKIRELGRLASERGDDKKADYYRNLPILTLTSDNSDETKEKFIKAGANDSMEKPINICSVKKKLLKWLPKELVKAVQE